MYLLDTHTLLWARLEPTRLKGSHKEILLTSDKQKLISTVSIWEISLKFALGKLELGGHNPEEFFETAIDLGFEVMPPEPDSFISFYRLKSIPLHNDPFDRMLIWQAICSRLTLLSSDIKMSQYKPEGLVLA